MNATQIQLVSHGVSDDCLTLKPVHLGPVAADDVLIKVLFSPINPSDINMMEGRYYINPDLPFTLGKEGVGEILEVGEQVTDVSVGDRVIMPYEVKGQFVGWWATHLKVPARLVEKIPASIPPEQAAMMCINPPTALRLLSDFVPLKPGDWIVQNAANSGVGRSVIQIAREKGLRTLNVVRRDALVAELKALGADEVVIYGDDLAKRLKAILNGAPCLLGLNAVGGESASQIAKSLSPKGTLVTYGAMSKQPVTIGNAQLIYKDLQFKGFNRTRWMEESSRADTAKTIQEVISLYDRNTLQLPVNTVIDYTALSQLVSTGQFPPKKGKILLKF